MANFAGNGQDCLYEVLCIRNAKFLAVLIVLGSFFYHSLLHVQYGNDSCELLLTDGHFHGNKVWQPNGCMAHAYTKSDAQDCMRYIAYWGGYNYVVFIGDSRIRQLYFNFVQFIGNDKIEPHKAHADLHFHDNKFNIHVAFIWQPIVNESMLEVYQGWVRLPPSSRPNLVITGSSTWSIKMSNASEEALQHFKENITIIVATMELMNNSTKILWMLQEPVVEEHLSLSRSMITNTQIDSYNRATYEALMFSSVQIWSSSRLVAHGFLDEMEDGIHAGESALGWDTQILLNMYCNKHLSFDDGTCCTTAKQTTFLQVVVLAALITSLVIAVSMFLWRTYVTSTPVNVPVQSESVDASAAVSHNNDDSCFEFFTCLARLALIMLYFFICDRTTFFMKENKYYSNMNFFLPFAYLMIVGVFFNEKAKVATVLNRDQTDEWKGWMQLIILIYHFTGASKVLTIYMHIRVFVSAYLFLSGYGHFSYFFNNGDFSIHRLLSVLVRFNLLVVLLSFVMDRPYQFYYFVPMVSFWFIVVYMTMAIYPRVALSSANSVAVCYFTLMVKVAVLLTGISLLSSSHIMFDKIFLSWPWRDLFISDDDSLHSWHFRWKLDRYTTISGAVFAFIFIAATKIHAKTESPVRWSLLRLSFVGLLALGSVVGYEILIIYCQSKQQCNNIHSFIMFVPILSFIYFRNFLGCLRAKYSTFFAWFGKISLELFISQYHIWLSADTQGLLVLVPGSLHVNAIVTSFVFVCVSHEIHCITEQLLPYLVPSDWRRLTRNVFIGLVVGVLLNIRTASSPV